MVRNRPSLSDHSFSTRHLGLYPSAFLFTFLRVFFEVKTPQCLYCRRFRVNPAAPKSPVFRFIHSVFQSPGTLSTTLLQPTLDIVSYAYIASICVIAIRFGNHNARMAEFSPRRIGFTFVLGVKVIGQPKVQVLPILAGQMDGKRDLSYWKTSTFFRKSGMFFYQD